MTPKDVLPWLTLVATLLAAGMWLGKMQQQIVDLQDSRAFYHGDYHQQAAEAAK